jgi:hypothetical protein
MKRRLAVMIERIAAGSARPDWTLLAISYLFSGALVLALQSIF